MSRSDEWLDPMACHQRDMILDDEDRERWEWIEWVATHEPGDEA